MARPIIHDETVRRRLLEVSSEIIAEQGADAVSVRKAAAAAQTTTAAIYALFGSREALIEAVIIEGFRRFAAHLAEVPHTAAPATDLLALARAYRANAVQNPHFYRVMFTDWRDSNSSEYGAETFNILVNAVERAAECGATEAATRAHRVWAYVHGLVSLELAGFAEASGNPEHDENAYLEAVQAAAPLVWGSAA